MLIVLLVLALFGVGWLLYQPVYNWLFSGASPAQESSSMIDEPPAEQSSSQPEETSQSQQEQGETPIVQGQKIRAAYLPLEVLTNTAAIDNYVEGLPSQVNTVVLPLKDNTGSVLYRSALSQVSEAQAQAKTAVDLKTLTQKLHAAGLQVLGQVGTFEDHIAPRTLTDASVKYSGTTYSWLDNSPEQGGRMWLNPYAQEAQSYILDIVKETLEFGVDGIVLDGLQFPEGYALDRADYGDTGTTSRVDCLTAFAAQATDLVEETGGVGCWVWLSAKEYLLSDDAQRGPYGGAIEELARNVDVLVDVTPFSFGTSFEGGGITLTAPMTQPAQTVTQVLTAMNLPEERNVLALIQADDANGYAAEIITPLDKGMVTGQIDAAAQEGSDGYVAYSPTGDYSLLH